MTLDIRCYPATYVTTSKNNLPLRFAKKAKTSELLISVAITKYSNSRWVFEEKQLNLKGNTIECIKCALKFHRDRPEKGRKSLSSTENVVTTLLDNT